MFIKHVLYFSNGASLIGPMSPGHSPFLSTLSTITDSLRRFVIVIVIVIVVVIVIMFIVQSWMIIYKRKYSNYYVIPSNIGH